VNLASDGMPVDPDQLFKSVRPPVQVRMCAGVGAIRGHPRDIHYFRSPIRQIDSPHFVILPSIIFDYPPCMEADIKGDAKFVDMAKIRQARAMSPEEKFFAGPRLFQGVCERMKEALREENPDSNESEIHAMLRERLRLLQKLEERNHTA